MHPTLPALILLMLAPSSFSQQNITVVTSKGPVVGLRWTPNPRSGASYDAFLGIPYGQIPNRFQPAIPRSNWTKPLYTQKDGPVCPQPFASFSEDCLYLNVFTPNASAPPGTYPVVAYIHGSAFTAGSSSSLVYGPDLVVPRGVILVAMNYRMGATGFLALPPVALGNQGLLDTQLALSWVQQEISRFGGNPGQVTLAGQSAGSVMTMYHYLSNTSSAMFQRAIAHSGSALATWGHVATAEATRRAKQLAIAVGCNTTQNDSQILSCLQAADINAIVNHQNITLELESSGNQLPFVPVIDTSFGKPPFFTDSIANLVKEAAARGKPLVTGFTTEEGIFLFSNDKWKLVQSNLKGFVPWRLEGVLNDAQKDNLGKAVAKKYFPNTVDENKVLDVINIYTDYLFAYPAIDLMKQLSNVTYGYVFAYNGGWATWPMTPFITKYHITGVSHGADISYIFYMGQDLGKCTSNQGNLMISQLMVDWWINFITNGIPDNLRQWGPISTGKYLLIDSSLKMVNASDIESHYYDFWANLTEKSLSNAPITTQINVFLICIALFVLTIKL